MALRDEETWTGLTGRTGFCDLVDPVNSAEIKGVSIGLYDSKTGVQDQESGSLYSPLWDSAHLDEDQGPVSHEEAVRSAA